MKVTVINGSHRVGKSTSSILDAVCDDFRERGWQAEFVELSKLRIDYCIGCNACLLEKECPLHDDFDSVLNAIAKSDAVVLGSPNYFLNVTARMKCFMDRMRPPHLAGDVLSGKVAGIVCTTGLNNAGADCVVNILKRFCDAQGWVTIGGTTVVASWEESRTDDGVRYRKSAALDPRGVSTAEKMVVEIDALCRGIAAS